MIESSPDNLAVDSDHSANWHFAKLASTVTPQPVVAVAGVPASPVLGDALASATFVSICWESGALIEASVRLPIFAVRDLDRQPVARGRLLTK